jgi:hypothetical protein
MNFRLLCATWLCVLFHTFPSNKADATLNVSVLDTTLEVGGDGTIDVEISGTGDLVAGMFLELRITPIGGVASSLIFEDPQTVSFRNDANYLFFADSANENGAFDPRSVFQDTLQQDSFADNDGTSSLSNVSVTASRLLGRISLKHIVPLGTLPDSVVGDTFLVSVIGSSGDFTETDFVDSDLNAIDFTSTAGTVRLQATAVPEPGSVAILTAMGVVAVYRKRRLLRK